MMLATHQMQSSHVVFCPTTLSWRRGMMLDRRVSTSLMVPRAERFITLKQRFPLRLAIRNKHRVRAKCLSISCFKGNPQKDESHNGSSKSKYPDNSAGISYVSPDNTPPKLQEVSVSCASQSNETISRSQAIQKLFRNWITLLWTESEEQVGQHIMEGSSQEVVQPQKGTPIEERDEVLKVVLRYFLGVDATIKIPLMIFVPMYLGVNLVYGAKVSKELTPVWIFGPVFTALYLKLVQWIFALYVITFKQTLKLCKELPIYFAIANKYITDRVWKPLANLKNMDLKQVSRRKWEEFKVDLSERWIDFVESIWPIYFRVLMFLKSTKLI